MAVAAKQDDLGIVLENRGKFLRPVNTVPSLIFVGARHRIDKSLVQEHIDRPVFIPLFRQLFPEPVQLLIRQIGMQPVSFLLAAQENEVSAANPLVKIDRIGIWIGVCQEGFQLLLIIARPIKIMVADGAAHLR